MEKIRNFGRVTYNRKKNQIDYSFFKKDINGNWSKNTDSKTIYNEVFLPNTEAVLKTRFGMAGGLVKDIWGNEILSGIPCDFYDRNPPEVVKTAVKSFSSDISPVVKFLSDNFEFNEEKDELPPLRVLYMDIETRVDDGGFLDGWDSGCDRGGILLISCYDNIENKTTVFGIKPFNHTTLPIEDKTVYIHCLDERALLREFLKYLKCKDFEIISGWNVSSFDIPYILNRMTYLFGEKALYHFGNANAWIKNQFRKCIVSGISIVDYMILYKKFELKPRRSYALANIVEEEGIKIDGRGKHVIEGPMKLFSETHWDEFVKYCIQDTKLVFELDNKKKLMDTFVMLCYMAGISFDSAIAQDISWLRIHDAAIYRYCKENKTELPTTGKPQIDEDQCFVGAYIMTPEVGLHDYITVFDVASLYPSCIRSLNISLDTYRGKVTHIYEPGSEDKVFNSNQGIFDTSFTLKRGQYDVVFYDPLYLSLREQEKKIIEKANVHLTKKVDPNIGQPKTMRFTSASQLLAYLKEHNLSLGSNGTIFTKGFRGIIPSLLDSWMDIRKKNKNLFFEYKKKYQETGDLQYKLMSERYRTIQDVYKIRLNSLYGFVGTKYSRFFDTDLSEAVTLTGQFILKSTMNALKQHDILLSAMYCDTDSIFLNYGKILKYRGINTNDKQACVKACLEIDNEVKSIIDSHLTSVTANFMNTPNYYAFESEEVYDKLLITSKKKYIARVLYDKTTKEYPKDEYTVKGLEFKKSNLSNPIKKMLRDITIRIMGGMTEEETLMEFKTIWNKIPEYPIDDIAYAQRVENLIKYGEQSSICIKNPKEAIADFQKGCPYHVIGALALNAVIDWDKDLHDMTKMVSGDKGKIIFVCPTNFMGVEAVVYTGDWNPKLYQYFKLDVEKIFCRLILSPLQPVLDAMNFNFTLDSILGFKYINSENTIEQMLLF